MAQPEMEKALKNGLHVFFYGQCGSFEDEVRALKKLAAHEKRTINDGTRLRNRDHL